jgi:hypothetical protein
VDDKQFTNGIIWFVTGLLLTGVSSFLGHFALFGGSTDLAQGFFDGLSVVACGAAIVRLVRSRRQAWPPGEKRIRWPARA